MADTNGERARWRAGVNSTDNEPYTRVGEKPTDLTDPKGSGGEPQYPRRVGCAGFDATFQSECDEVLVYHAQEPGSQHTRALVLKCCSGVGKTFLTVTLRAKNKALDRDVICSYLGLNSGWQLSENEKKFLTSAASAADTDAWSAQLQVEKLLFRRLGLSLAGLLEQCVSGNARSLDKLDIDGTDVQYMPYCPMEVEERLDHLEVATLKSKVLEILNQFPVASNRTLVVAVVVDEGHWPGQCLDVYHNSFARMALHCLRRLQDHVLTKTAHRILLMPIMTGINPATSEYDRSEGSNVTLRREDVMMNRDEFATLAKLISPKTKHVRHIADLLYPRVRTMIKFLCSSKLDYTEVNPGSIPDASFVFLAALAGSPISEQQVDTVAIAVEYEPAGGVRVILDVTVWSSLVVLHRGQFPRLPDTAFALPALTTAILARNANDSIAFEAQSFDVIRLFLAVFGPICLWLNNRVDRVVSDWLPPMNFLLTHTEDIDHPKEHHQPFQSSASHEKAYAGIASAQFTNAVKGIVGHTDELKKPCALWVRCLGSALIDFILLVCWREPEGALVGATRFMDAKHTSANDTTPPDIVGVSDKARKVHAGLARELLKLEGICMTLEPFDELHVAVVSNFRGEPVGRTFSPATFNWAPWTHIMYACAEPEVKTKTTEDAE